MLCRLTVFVLFGFGVCVCLLSWDILCIVFGGLWMFECEVELLSVWRCEIMVYENLSVCTQRNTSSLFMQPNSTSSLLM